jgi:hypothetical protein
MAFLYPVYGTSMRINIIQLSVEQHFHLREAAFFFNMTINSHMYGKSSRLIVVRFVLATVAPLVL